ncbi:hypothetical protein OEZ85_013728 [Tetradesmus obliquus]|uniref:GYF domain-containing protein n=1 Tax=Tetradesmus obliquus TaxID=3088 RepID=A0ABY8URA1_TETOB|nr:hypothetical protein OEZ85_013728 [Tetradesmus obliquus]
MASPGFSNLESLNLEPYTDAASAASEQQQQQQQQRRRSSVCGGSPGASSSLASPSSSRPGLASPTPTSPAAAAAAAKQGAGKLAAAAAAEAGSSSSSSSSEVPLLARELGVSVGSLGRLFRAEAEADFEQPVWMVVNLQGKIKGSYTTDKMLEFCRRGTLSAAQMVLGIDKNLPYVARQELAFYRPLGQLIGSVHAGQRYCPLTEEAMQSLAAAGASPAHWNPLTPSQGLGSDAAAAEGLAGDLCKLGLDPEAAGADACGGGSSSSSAAEGRVVAAAAAARLRAALQRLCGVGSAGGRVAIGAKQPLWLYINHLGWCRGPFSGGKVMHAHLCGRLPRNTLVVAYDPELPACMISGDVAQWFRPLGALLDNVANGWAYNTVKWQDVVSRGAFAGAAPEWQPLVWAGAGSPPPLQYNQHQYMQQQYMQQQQQQVGGAGYGAMSSFSAAGSTAVTAGMLMLQQQQQQQQQQLMMDQARSASLASSGSGPFYSWAGQQ